MIGVKRMARARVFSIHDRRQGWHARTHAHPRSVCSCLNSHAFQLCCSSRSSHCFPCSRAMCLRATSDSAVPRASPSPLRVSAPSVASAVRRPPRPRRPCRGTFVSKKWQILASELTSTLAEGDDRSEIVMSERHDNNPLDGAMGGSPRGAQRAKRQPRQKVLSLGTCESRKVMDPRICRVETIAYRASSGRHARGRAAGHGCATICNPDVDIQ